MDFIIIRPRVENTSTLSIGCKPQKSEEKMTLEEAIKHAEEIAEEKENEGKLLCNSEAGSAGCLKCAEEHRQLAEWLRDYN